MGNEKNITSSSFITKLNNTNNIISDSFVLKTTDKNLLSNSFIKKPGYENSISSDSFIKKLGYTLDEAERKLIRDSCKEPRLRVPFRWMKIPSSAHLGGEILPYISKVSMTDNTTAAHSPYSYYVAELGTICAAYKKSKGFIMVLYPKLDKTIQVFEVTYTKDKEMLQFLRETIDTLEDALRAILAVGEEVGTYHDPNLKGVLEIAREALNREE